MKQKLLTLKALLMVLMMTLGFGHAFAEDTTVSFDFSAQGYANQQAIESITLDANVSATLDKGTNSNAPKYYTTGTAVRMYGGNTMTLTTTSGVIKSVEFTFSSGEGTNAITSNNGEYKNGTWTGSNASVTFTIGGTTGHRRIKSMSVTYGESGAAPAATKPSLTEGCVFSTTPFDVVITNNEAGSTVYYTVDGADPTTSSASFTGESKTIQISETTTVKAMAVASGKSNSAVASATYEKSIANTLETAYTTEEAKALIDAGSKQLETVKVYVKGTISKVDSYNQTYGSIQYWLDDNTFEIYGGLNNNGERFASVDDVKVGAEVVCYGIIKKYDTTYEMDKNGWLVSYKSSSKETATIEATVAKAALTVGTNDVYDVTYNGDGELSVKSSNESVATVAIEGTTVTVTPLAAGTTTITISAPATENYTAATKSYSVTVTKPATLPFSFDGGKDDIADTDGMSQNELGSDYSASPKLKFDTQSDNVIINFNEAAKKVTYTIKGNSTSGTYAFDVMESADGVNYNTVHSHTSITNATSYTDNLASTSRFVKFVYTTKANGNVALGKISIVAANAVENPELAFAKTSYRFLTTDSEKSVSASSAKGSTGAITYSCDNTNLTIDATTGIITCTTAGTYTVKASIAAVEGYEAADATCTVTVIEPAVANSIIVAETNDGKYFAMTNTANSSGYLVSVEINKIDNKYYVSEENYDKVLYAVSSTENSVTIVNKLNEYLQATAAKNVSFTENEYKWTLADNVLTAANPNHGTLQYNSSNPRFTTYGSKIGSYATIVSLDNVVKSNTVTANLQITDAGVATFCAPFDVDLNKVEGIDATAYTATVEDGWVKLSEIESGVIVAGTAVVLQGTEMAEAKTLTGVPATTEATCATGCLTGNLSAVTSVAIGNFLLQKQTAGLAWYKVTEEGLKIGTNRCYLTKEAVSDARTVLNMDLNPTGIDSIATEAKTKADGKYLVNGKIIVVKAGKVYDLK